MKKVSKKSALAQLTTIYSAIWSSSLFSTFGRRLCSLYAWACSGVLEQSDIDTLRNQIIEYVQKYRSFFPPKEISIISTFLNYDFNV